MLLDPQVSLVILKDEDRRELVESLSGYEKMMTSTRPSKAVSLSNRKVLQYFIIWYINRNANKAFDKSFYDDTKKQHTVPNFANKSLGKRFNSFTPEIVCNQTINFGQGLQSLKATYSYQNQKWELFPMKTEKISVFHNIYDLTASTSNLPVKFVECFLSMFEDDAAKIIQRLTRDKTNRVLTWAERVILSCYAVLQGIRTIGWKEGTEKTLNQLIVKGKIVRPNMTEEEIKQSVIAQLGRGFQDFGYVVLESLTFDAIDIFLSREWTFFDAPDGLITSLYPLGSLDLDRWKMFSGGIIQPTQLMFPLGRNLLWMLSKPNSKIGLLNKKNISLTSDENRFVNEILSLKVDTVYCHPDDAVNIFPHLYRTDAINFYSKRPSALVNDSNDPFKIEKTTDLFNSVPSIGEYNLLHSCFKTTVRKCSAVLKNVIFFIYGK